MENILFWRLRLQFAALFQHQILSPQTVDLVMLCESRMTVTVNLACCRGYNTQCRRQLGLDRVGCTYWGISPVLSAGSGWASTSVDKLVFAGFMYNVRKTHWIYFLLDLKTPCHAVVLKWDVLSALEMLSRRLLPSVHLLGYHWLFPCSLRLFPRLLFDCHDTLRWEVTKDGWEGWVQRD